eukprot:798634-Rhodomonas_salina.1
MDGSWNVGNMFDVIVIAASWVQIIFRSSPRLQSSVQHSAPRHSRTASEPARYDALTSRSPSSLPLDLPPAFPPSLSTSLLPYLPFPRSSAGGGQGERGRGHAVQADPHLQGPAPLQEAPLPPPYHRCP